MSDGLIAERFHLRKLRGSGGTAAVFEADDTRHGRRVAVKLLHPHLAVGPVAWEAFFEEVRAAQAIAQPNIAEVYDAGLAPGDPPVAWIAMELVEGVTLADHVRERGPLTIVDAVAVFAAVLDATGAAHAGGVVHRDITPSNIMLTSSASADADGTVSGIRLLDFGLADVPGRTTRGADPLLSGAASEGADAGVVASVPYAQQQLSDTCRAQLAAGTAPVSEGDFDDVLLADGAPVGIIDIPRLGVHEVIAEGTSSGVLAGGPGHRRDTVLPGQVGVSVVMGRAAAFGGPFGRLQSLQPGERFEVRTGQGLNTFEVLGVRYAGDPTPPAPVRGESRLILLTARGAPYVPTGIAYVDARLVDKGQPPGARQTTPITLPPSHAALATDTTTVWALVFALQFLVAAEIAAVWAFRRVGAQKTWIVFVPILLLASVFVCDQLVRLLPNLL